MNKIDLFLVLMVMVGVFSISLVDITGNIVKECYDSDGGIDPFVGGNLVGYDEITKRDLCKDDNTLYEYYCESSKSKGVFEEFNCYQGCVTENGKGKCLRKKELRIEDLRQGKCSTGCYYKGTCYLMGIRTVDGLFCDADDELKWQVLDNEPCNNNFECRSNLCIINKCISTEVFNKFLESLE